MCARKEGERKCIKQNSSRQCIKQNGGCLYNEATNNNSNQHFSLEGAWFL